MNYSFEICRTGGLLNNYYFVIQNNSRYDVDCIIQSNSMFYGAFRLNKRERRSIDRRANSSSLISALNKDEKITAMFYPHDPNSPVYSGFEILEIDNFYGFKSHPEKSGLMLRKAPDMTINPKNFYVV